MVKTKQSAQKRKPQEASETYPSEIIAAVGSYFCRGFTPSTIAELVEHDFPGIKMKRETPYKLIQQAGKSKMLQFIAPGDDDLSKKISADYKLQKTEVVLASHVDDVARRAAIMLLEMIRAQGLLPHNKKQVHVGFAGGNTVRLVAQHLAALLERNTGSMPDQIVFHALAAGFDMNMPLTDPNAFFTYFISPALYDPTTVDNDRGRDKENQEKKPSPFAFVMLQAPGLVPSEQFDLVKSLPTIETAFAEAENLDIIVASAARVKDEHSMVDQYYVKKYEGLDQKLTEAHCTGDMLWQPLGPDGPIDTAKYPVRSMTLVDLAQIPEKINNGKQVLLVLGPCGICRMPKTEILDTILCQKSPLITHLVTDSRTARGLFESSKSPRKK